jgi:hypothetical protein
LHVRCIRVLDFNAECFRQSHREFHDVVQAHPAPSISSAPRGACGARTRVDARTLSPPECRDKSRHGTQECVRYAIAPPPGAPAPCVKHADRLQQSPAEGSFRSAPCRLFARNGVGHRTVAGWREESFEDLHPRGSGS